MLSEKIVIDRKSRKVTMRCQRQVLVICHACDIPLVIVTAVNVNSDSDDRKPDGRIVPGKRQASVPHSRVSSLSPSQSAPPSAGSGLVQER